MNDTGEWDDERSADEAWREMRLHMEWNEALSLCFLFTPDARAVADIRQWASDNFAYRTAPLLVVEPRQPANASAEVLSSLQQHVHNLSMVRAPVWLQLLAIDDTSQTGWDSSRAELLSRLNEAREWLVKSFARPLVVCLPPAWRHRVVALAPDLWHIRSYSVLLAPVVASAAPDHAAPGTESHVLPSVTERQLAAAKPVLEAARSRQIQQPRDPSLQRELGMALDDWGDANLDAGRASEALAAYRESLQLRRELRQSLGDSPQVLDDLAVSLERIAQLGGDDPQAQHAAVDEAITLRERLVAVTQRSVYHSRRLQTAQALSRHLGQGTTEPLPLPPAPTTTG